MDRLLLILGLAMLAVFVVITYMGPRRYGWAGLIGVHLIVLCSYAVFTGISLSAGVYEYDGAESMIGLAMQVFVLNCLLLPLGLVGLWMRRRRRRRDN